MKTKEELLEMARQYIVDKGFMGFANNSSVPSWMADFADQETAELKRNDLNYKEQLKEALNDNASLRSEIASLRSKLDDCKRRAITGQRI